MYPGKQITTQDETRCPFCHCSLQWGDNHRIETKEGKFICLLRIRNEIKEVTKEIDK